MELKWIPITERLPEVGKYVLVSFKNWPTPSVGRYDEDECGRKAFYPGSNNFTYSSFGFFVNAWMPLPERYEEENNAQNER
ncbi:MAG: DUF551 domain-containing protein [Eubacteriales bacterium]|nr:DUF551 domain-containing protein [Eubacteriales bacterium]